MVRGPRRAGPLTLAVLLAAAAPEPAPVQQVPQEAALAVLGQSVRGHSGGELGRLVDVLVNQAGQPVAAVIDFGGFLGVGNRKIAVDWHSLRFSPEDKDHPIELEMEPDQVRAAPEYRDQHPVPVVVPPGRGGAADAARAEPPGAHPDGGHAAPAPPPSASPSPPPSPSNPTPPATPGATDTSPATSPKSSP